MRFILKSGKLEKFSYSSRFELQMDIQKNAEVFLGDNVIILDVKKLDMLGIRHEYLPDAFLLDFSKPESPELHIAYFDVATSNFHQTLVPRIVGSLLLLRQNQGRHFADDLTALLLHDPDLLKVFFKGNVRNILETVREMVKNCSKILVVTDGNEYDVQKIKEMYSDSWGNRVSHHIVGKILLEGEPVYIVNPDFKFRLKEQSNGDLHTDFEVQEIPFSSETEEITVDFDLISYPETQEHDVEEIPVYIEENITAEGEALVEEPELVEVEFEPVPQQYQRAKDVKSVLNAPPPVKKTAVGKLKTVKDHSSNQIVQQTEEQSKEELCSPEAEESYEISPDEPAVEPISEFQDDSGFEEEIAEEEIIQDETPEEQEEEYSAETEPEPAIEPQEEPEDFDEETSLESETELDQEIEPEEEIAEEPFEDASDDSIESIGEEQIPDEQEADIEIPEESDTDDSNDDSVQEEEPDTEEEPVSDYDEDESESETELTEEEDEISESEDSMEGEIEEPEEEEAEETDDMPEPEEAGDSEEESPEEEAEEEHIDLSEVKWRSFTPLSLIKTQTVKRLLDPTIEKTMIRIKGDKIGMVIPVGRDVFVHGLKYALTYGDVLTPFSGRRRTVDQMHETLTGGEQKLLEGILAVGSETETKIVINNASDLDPVTVEEILKKIVLPGVLRGSLLNQVPDVPHAKYDTNPDYFIKYFSFFDKEAMEYTDNFMV
jgi:hypothetical protein